MRATVVIDPETMDWSPGPEDLPPGAMLKVLSADEETGAVAALVKFPAGYLEPKHGQPGDEQGHVLLRPSGGHPRPLPGARR
jgi:hypothetical protein